MKVHEMKDWDAGQLLIARSDDLWDAFTDLDQSGFGDQAEAVKKAAEVIGDIFNKKHMGKSHVFGLRGSKTRE